MSATTKRATLFAATTLAMAPFAARAAVDGPALSMIPAVHGTMSVLRFHAQPTGQSFLRETLGRLGAATTEQQAGAVTKFTATGRLAAFTSQDGADTEAFADLDHMPAGHLAARSASTVARGVFARADVIPQDATTLSLATPSVLYAGDSHGGAAHALMTNVAARRVVDGLPVLGAGSRASVGIGNDGSVQAFVKHWRPAERAESVAATASREEVQASIVRQLTHFETATTHVVVDRVGLGYYDGNGAALQPVYYFTARLLPHGMAARVLHDGDAVVGYVPVGATVEAIPDLAAAPSGDIQAPVGGQVVPNGWGTGVTLGDYVVRNDDPNWVADGNAFTAALAGTGLSRTQYYWAYPFEYLSSANAYVNSVNVGVTEAHGDWGLFTTYQNWGDVVNLNQIGSGGNPGYGAYGSANKLAHWWIHSCEVIPSMFDEAVATGNAQNAFNIWWNIFNGLHQAIGYRTIMFIADGAGAAYGNSLYYGAGMTSAWINTVTSLSDYTQGWTYLSYHLNRQVPYGEPSVISIPNLQNTSVFATGAAQPARNVGMYNYWVQGATD